LLDIFFRDDERKPPGIEQKQKLGRLITPAGPMTLSDI
jgi:hypothetical protein